MPKYCLDTSGLSNPLMSMPEDIFAGLWTKVRNLISIGVFCYTTEIADECAHIQGSVGGCLKAHRGKMVYEVGHDHWNWQSYLGHVTRMTQEHRAFVSEYNRNRSDTIGLNDLSIVALAKTLSLPVVSMEGSDGGQISANKMRIPRLCIIENVDHYNFNDLLRREGIII